MMDMLYNKRRGLGIMFYKKSLDEVVEVRKCIIEVAILRLELESAQCELTKRERIKYIDDMVCLIKAESESLQEKEELLKYLEHQKFKLAAVKQKLYDNSKVEYHQKNIFGESKQLSQKPFM